MNNAEIRSLVEKGSVIIGHNAVHKAIVSGAVQRVLIASNAESELVTDIQHLCSLGSIDCDVLDLRNDQLGVACRKPFQISFLAVKK